MTNSANQFWKFSSWISFLAALGFFLLALPNGDTPAAETKRNVQFDHVKTGFPLTGAHVQVPCETCHVQGAFKGTPKKCETCHTPDSRIQTATVKPSNHIPTQQACNQCHSSTASWTVARFSHVGVVPHQCEQCHNNIIVPGKPANHPVTSQPCDSCHRSTTWMSASFTHLGVTPGTCATCHGSSATGKPTNHIPTTLSCDACHNTSTYTSSTFSHSVIQGVLPGQCATCHNGAYTQWNALGKTPNHVATTASCDSCHTGYVSFVMAGGSTFNHAGVVPGACATCHGSSATGKPSNHIPTSLSCDACHSTGGTFTTSTFTHSATQGVLPLQCATCHNGSYTQWNALGKPPGHLATTASCDTCHTGYTTFTGATFNHTGIGPGTCSTCHYQGGPGMATPNNHIPYASQLLSGASMNCDSCHKSTNTGGFMTQTMNHNNSQGNGAGWCKGCHQSGTNYLGTMQTKSLTHQKSSGVTDCSQSGCHRPLGTQGTAYSRWTN